MRTRRVVGLVFLLVCVFLARLAAAAEPSKEAFLS